MSSKLTLLAVPFSYTLVSFIAYPSQWLFRQIDPGPLTRRQSILFNIGTLCVFISYARCVLVDPGRVVTTSKQTNGTADPGKQRWCKKCDAYKPPRSHHCKVCKRCILKMDHHCPWTINCVGHRTLPHFLRFLTWGLITMLYLQKHFFTRGATIWENRNRAYYLGPTQGQLVWLMVLVAVNSITLLFIGILALRTWYSIAINMTSVESWEMERHEALLKRARKRGGWVGGAGGTSIRIVRHEFPYDVGIWRNITLCFGSSNPLMWLNPFSPSHSHESGMRFEDNGFLGQGLSWPPPDPDKMPAQRQLTGASDPGFMFDDDMTRTEDEYVVAFKRRQNDDLRRRRALKPSLRGPAANCGGLPGEEDEDDEELQASSRSKQQWRNEEGETLDDYGVEEEEEEEGEDEDVPLSELIARRRMTTYEN